ncbi:uncharacterized protein LOC6541034 [Drosophila erecta]|uniref:Uncharacterized protein n=1 Tax=Drosophila erecta TaxID=7220 RepID=B3N9D2_DROER|nr:uncharacterized protein LOC6541034 [Drosophila erecta]EDV59619.1 uncharacterized protein Dere_GG23310 [Drosophila erecta]
MPICKSSPGTASKKTATDISADHVTEAAQVKRTREQAYFNSYDFDAIEVLPYEEDDDEAGGTGRSRSRSQSRSQSRSGSNSSRSSSTRSYSAAKEPGAGNKFTYLQRLGAFFARNGGGAGESGSGSGEAASIVAPSGGGASNPAPKGSSDNFLLPRAMLKYQSTATASASASASPSSTSTSTAAAAAPMPPKNGLANGMGNAIGHDQQLEATAVVGERSKKCSIASNVSSTHSTDSGLPVAAAAASASASASAATSVTAATSAAIPACAAGTARGVGGGGGSHYSTDKSGSSGYYSSNVCSTYSLDEHIYCEPVIDAQEKIKSVAARQRQRPPLQLPTKVGAPQEAHSADPPEGSPAKLSAVKSQRSDMQDAAGAAASNDHQTQSKAEAAEGLHHYSKKLRVLETSIENLDRHLKTFPSLYAQEHIVSFMQVAGRRSEGPPQALDIGEKLRAYNQLPTIMEQQQQQQQQQHQEQMVDDSLLDIDLDAFLLAPNAGHCGIDNPSFLNDEQLAENNYKCAKYINSCPEDAYRLESERGGAGAAGVGVAEETFAKRYEDQLHFQNTRELLEDVRDKIRLLSRATPQNSASPTPASTPPSDVPKELEGMIHTLKHELESYLQRMNQHSELELRQLCSGLGRQQHVVRMQNALERRRSCADLQLNAYEAVRDGVLISANGRPLSVREQIMTIRCASDPNFKMKRKSIAEIFPAAECYVESEVTTTSLSRSVTPSPASTPQLELEALHPGPATTTIVTQMQRNLTFHKPILTVSNSSPGAGNVAVDGAARDKAERDRERESLAEWHRKKPSIWEMYYGTNRLHQSLLGKQRGGGELVISSAQPTLSYPSSRPESDFTLDLPRAEQLRLKMEKEKKFRQRCRFITTFLSLVFFLLTVMVVSLVLTRGKRMFGSMI